MVDSYFARKALFRLDVADWLGVAMVAAATVAHWRAGKGPIGEMEGEGVQGHGERMKEGAPRALLCMQRQRMGCGSFGSLDCSSARCAAPK